MKGLIITHRGFEDITATEIKELIGAESETKPSAAVFSYKHFLELCALSYQSQSAIKVLHLICRFHASNELEETKSELKKTLSETDLSQWISENTTFKVTCNRTGEHKYTSQDMISEAGKLLKDKINKEVNFDSPDLIFHIHIINDSAYLGIDFAGIDLSKREYRIFAHPAALKGTVGYCMLRFAGYKKKQSLLDPFTKSGIIPIEAALYSLKRPVNYYRKEALAFRHLKPLENEDWEAFFSKIDKETDEETKLPIYGMDSSMPSITAAQKNAKLAGVNKNISFSRLEIEWIDTKFSKGDVDRIVAHPPGPSKRVEQKFIEKLYKELFYQTEYVLSEKGTAAYLARDTELLKKHAEQYKLKTEEERTIQLGKESLKAIKFSK